MAVSSLSTFREAAADLDPLCNSVLLNIRHNNCFRYAFHHLQTREMAVSSLSTFQKAAQRTAFQTAAEGALKPLFTAEDATGLLALMLHDAATYDAETKTGGYDGSILINRWVAFIRKV